MHKFMQCSCMHAHACPQMIMIIKCIKNLQECITQARDSDFKLCGKWDQGTQCNVESAHQSTNLWAIMNGFGLHVDKLLKVQFSEYSAPQNSGQYIQPFISFIFFYYQ